MFPEWMQGAAVSNDPELRDAIRELDELVKYSAIATNDQKHAALYRVCRHLTNVLKTVTRSHPAPPPSPSEENGGEASDEERFRLPPTSSPSHTWEHYGAREWKCSWCGLIHGATNAGGMPCLAFPAEPCETSPVAPVDVGGLRKDSHAEHQREALRETDDVPGDDRAGRSLVDPVHRGGRETGAVGAGRGERDAGQERAELPPGARFVVGEQVEAWHRVTGRVAWCGTGPDACVGIVDEDGEEWDFAAEQVRKADA